MVHGVDEGSEAIVGKDASIGIDSTLTFREAFIVDALFISASSRIYSTSMCQMSMEDVGVISMCVY